MENNEERTSPLSNTSAYHLFGIDFAENPEQKELIRLINEDPYRRPVVYCKGNAGTGKTFAALAGALAQVRGHGAKKRYKTVYYVREPVEMGHRLGYLKGKEEDKYAPYLGALLDNYNHLMAFGKKSGIMPPPLRQPSNGKKGDEDPTMPQEYLRLPSDIIPLAPEFLRGRSFEDCIILVDEAQNLTMDELQTIVTRIGNGCKMVILGSPNQIDIQGQTVEDNAFMLSYEILKPTGLIGFVELTKPMRSSFVSDFDQAFVNYKLTHPKK